MARIKYPYLANLFKQGDDIPVNFPLICQTLKACFADVFDLDALEKEAKLDAKDKSNYFLFFKYATQDLAGLVRPSEIVKKVYDHLLLKEISFGGINNKSTYQFRYGFLIKRDGVQAHPRQIGYLEKLTTGKLKPTEPLTYIDMWRALENYKIIHLQNLNAFDTVELREAKTIVIDFNQNPSLAPKWGFVDIKKRLVFCESALTEAEKDQLENKLDLGKLTYESDEATDRNSSGYMVIAKLSGIPLESDFYSLRWEICRVLMRNTLSTFDTGYEDGSKRIGIGYNLFFNDDNKYCSEEFQHHLINSAGMEWDTATRFKLLFAAENDRTFLDKHLDRKLPRITNIYSSNQASALSRVSELGHMNEGDFKMYDICDLLKFIAEKELGWRMLYGMREKAIRSNIYKFTEALAECPKAKPLIHDDGKPDYIALSISEEQLRNFYNIKREIHDHYEEL